MDTFAVSSSDFQKRYKTVIERVKQTKHPAVLMNKNKPQAVLVSLKDYNKLQEIRWCNSAKISWPLRKKVRELLKTEKLPSDLSIRHDYYLWEEGTETS